MLWLLVTLGLMSCLGSESETLTVREPVVGKILAGETLKFKLALPKGQRTSVTLIPLDGDVDLFVLLPPITSINQTPFKSTNVALQVERVILPAQPKETEAAVCVVGVTETQFVLRSVGRNTNSPLSLQRLPSPTLNGRKSLFPRAQSWGR